MSDGTHGSAMRANIELDDKPPALAMRITRQETKGGTVEGALRRLVQVDRQRRAMDKLADMGWHGDLDAMRRDLGR